MKRILISLCAAFVAGFSLVACTPDAVSGLDENGMPGIGGLEVNVSVDQTTNMVSFSVTNNDTSITPVWIFSETDIVMTSSFERRYRTAGTYTVEVKAFNRNGNSDASVVEEFTLDQDYVVPMHPLFGTGEKRWKVAAKTLGHLALGETIETSDGWWSAQPDEKENTGFYDDRVTFKGDGTYIYDPGPDGLSFVNGSLLGGGDDGDMPGTLQTTTYTLDESAMTLTLPQGTFTPYIANQEQLDGPWTYTVKVLDDNQLLLAWYTGGLAWQLILEPETRVERSPLWGNGTKTWKIASMLDSHLALGGAYPTEWYNAAPYEKESTGFYDDRVTFGEDGSYIYDPGPDGLTFVNGSMAGGGDDYDMEGTRKEATYTFDEDAMTLVLPEGVNLPYIANPAQIASDWTYTVGELGADKLLLSWWQDEQSMFWQIILVPEDYVGEDDGGDEPPPYDPGAQLEVAQFAEALIGSWTWESSSAGHFGCGESITNPTGWWSAGSEAQVGCSFYDDVMTFAEEGVYKFDPVDGMTYRNNGVTNYPGTVIDKVGDDYRVAAMSMESTYTYTAEGDFPSFTLPASVLFSYIASNDQLTTLTTYYITAMWENQVEISWYSPGISWRYRLKRVVEAE